MAALLLPLLALGAVTAEREIAATGPARIASASATATVRIMTPALIGPEYGAPAPGMEPRSISVALPDGRSASITVYEFE